MVHLDTISGKLIAEVNESSSLSSRQKHDLEAYITSIFEKLPSLYIENEPAVEGICNFLVCVIFESTRKQRNSVLTTNARKGMLLSFRPFEETYPALVTTAYEFGDALSALGV